MALAYQAATVSGVLAALLGSSAELAARCDLDETALRAVLGLLAAWGIVATDDHGRYIDGPAAPAPSDGAMLSQHGVWIRRWTALLGKRLRHRAAASDEAPARPPTDVGLDLLAVISRRLIRPVLDVCLERFPHARRVLDLGGSHGEYSLELARRGLQTTMQDRPEVIEIAERRGHLGSAGVELSPETSSRRSHRGHSTSCCVPRSPTCSTGPATTTSTAGCDRSSRPAGAWRSSATCAAATGSRRPSGLQMLVATEGGDAHGEGDYRRWLAEAGHGPTQLHDLNTPLQTIVLAGR